MNELEIGVSKENPTSRIIDFVGLGEQRQSITITGIEAQLATQQDFIQLELTREDGQKMTLQINVHDRGELGKTFIV